METMILSASSFAAALAVAAVACSGCQCSGTTEEKTTLSTPGAGRDLRPRALPVVYHPDYNITLAGMERLHPFDSRKYGRVVQSLQELGVLTAEQLVTPALPAEAFFRAHLDPAYLRGLSNKDNIASYTEIPPVAWLPSFLVRRNILRPMQLATAGTVEAARLALRHGWAINLGGGYHHASLDAGGGFCIYPDITLAVRVIRKEQPKIKKVMIIDLDAHQGNGHERDLGQDPDVFILDMYNHGVYPSDAAARRGIDLDVAAPAGISTKAYLRKLGEALHSAFARVSPQLVIYNAGTDILAGDPLGGMNVSEAGVIQRDQLVFAKALKERVPVVMVLSGGYQKTNAAIIARSIKNLFSTFDLKHARRK